VAIRGSTFPGTAVRTFLADNLVKFGVWTKITNQNPSVARPTIRHDKMKRAAGFVEPMLLLPSNELPDGPGWLRELKLDGYRTWPSSPLVRFISALPTTTISICVIRP